MTWTPVTQYGQHPLNGKSFYGGAVCATITNGVITGFCDGTIPFKVFDSSTTNPVNLCYQVVIKDTTTGTSFPPYPCVQPSSSAYWCSVSAGTASCNWDQFMPANPSAAQVQAGPPGPGCSSGTGLCIMSMPIVLPADPTTALQASTKQYVDNSIIPQRMYASSNLYLQFTTAPQYVPLLVASRPITVTAFTFTLSTAPVGCSANGQISLFSYYNSGLYDLADYSINQTSAGVVTEGSLSINLAAGSQVFAVVSTAAAGCSTLPTVSTEAIEYKMTGAN